MSGFPKTPPTTEESSAGQPTPGDGTAEFERVDWGAVDGGPGWASAERLTLIAGVLALLAVFIYHRSTGGGFLILRWLVGWEDWVLLGGLVVFVASVLVPFARRPQRAVRVVGRLRRNRTTLFCLAIIGLVLIAGSWALLNGFQPRLTYEVGTDGLDELEPPLGFTYPTGLHTECTGGSTELEGPRKLCHGSLTYPLGTDVWGYDMVDLLIVGAIPSVYIVIVTVGLIIPLATIVGLVAGLYGGIVDDLLMAYVDMQLSVPAIILYLIVYMFFFSSMLMFLVAFGLLSWGGIARIVRSETLQRREEGYVRSARAIGASRPYLIRRHVLPNVTNSVVPAMFHLIAVMILTEAGLSFLGFNPLFQSWGMTIAEGIQYASSAWWNAAIPAIALGITVAACKLAGDGLRDILDPYQ